MTLQPSNTATSSAPFLQGCQRRVAKAGLGRSLQIPAFFKSTFLVLMGDAWQNFSPSEGKGLGFPVIKGAGEVCRRSYLLLTCGQWRS